MRHSERSPTVLAIENLEPRTSTKTTSFNEILNDAPFAGYSLARDDTSVLSTNTAREKSVSYKKEHQNVVLAITSSSQGVLVAKIMDFFK